MRERTEVIKRKEDKKERRWWKSKEEREWERKEKIRKYKSCNKKEKRVKEKENAR